MFFREIDLDLFNLHRIFLISFPGNADIGISPDLGPVVKSKDFGDFDKKFQVNILF